MCGVRPVAILVLVLVAGVLKLMGGELPSLAHEPQQQEKPKKTASTQEAKPSNEKSILPEAELRQAMERAGNDRAALVRNLEAYLKKYPESPSRSGIYRALVEAEVQLQNVPQAADYAERLVALSPDDMSMTLVAVQLLERGGDVGGMRRATSYASRVLEFVQRESPAARSPQVSQQEWEEDRRRTRMTVLLVRGRIFSKLRDTQTAERDFEESYALVPNADAAERLGELAELQKNLSGAITQYARAFALAEGKSRQEVRRKLGNVWRLAHGTEEGLGEYLLRTFDETSPLLASQHPIRNAGAHNVYDFTLRRAPEGQPVSLADSRGKIVVFNFWATWCGPCRAQEPLFDGAANEFRDAPGVLFLAVNCDDDETLVPPYLKEEKPKTVVVYSDGLNGFLGVQSYPTVIVMDGDGKIAYRSEGFAADDFEMKLAEAVRRALDTQSPRW